jgi:hypothetical protein
MIRREIVITKTNSMRKLLTIIVGVFISMNLIHAQTSIPKAQSLFIYNFTRLIEWPQAAKTGDFVVGVFGNAPIAQEIGATLTGKKIGAQNVKIINYGSAGEIGQCHILVLPFGKSNEIGGVLSKIGNQGTLIVSEKKGMIENGAIINFIIDGNSLKFELNKEAASKRGLIISTALEKMAVTN